MLNGRHVTILHHILYGGPSWGYFRIPTTGKTRNQMELTGVKCAKETADTVGINLI